MRSAKCKLALREDAAKPVPVPFFRPSITQAEIDEVLGCLRR